LVTGWRTATLDPTVRTDVVTEEALDFAIFGSNALLTVKNAGAVSGGGIGRIGLALTLSGFIRTQTPLGVALTTSRYVDFRLADGVWPSFVTE
jgi:hypothetical protein